MRKIRIPRFAALTIAAFWTGSNAIAQDYPVKPIRFVVPNAPGGGTDIMARAISPPLTEALGQPVLVDNRAGATGAVGSTFVAKSPADGYTLLFVTSSTHAISPSLEKLPYDPVKDFEPISLFATGPQVMVAHPSVPGNSVRELVVLAKSRPNSLNYASPGHGSLGHMAAELFKSVTGTKIEHVPYKGAGIAVTDLLSGYIQLMFAGPGSVLPHVNARRLKALAVTSPKRAVGLENVPTFIESGYPAVDATQWFGVVAAAGTPKSIIDKLNREIVRVLQQPELQERFLANGANVRSSTPQEFAQLIKDDLAKWQKVVKASGARSN